MNEMTVMMLDIGNIDLIVDVVASIVGVMAIYMAIKLNHTLGGRVRMGLRFFMLGIGLNVIAIIWTNLFGHAYTIGNETFDVHNVFMAGSMILFVFSTYHFSLLVSGD